MADDQGPGMMRALPTVRRLIGERGTTFANAFASYPLCCPARATLLTGQYAHNHGAQGNNPRSGGGYRALHRPGAQPRRLAAGVRLRHRLRRQVAERPAHAAASPARLGASGRGLVGEGGEGLSSFYDYDVFEPERRAPRHLRHRARSTTRPTCSPATTRCRSSRRRPPSPRPFFLWLAYHPPHNGVGRDDPAGRRCSDGPPDSRRGKQSAIPPPRYARRFLHAPLPRPALLRRARRRRQARPSLRRKSRLSDADVERIERDYRCGLAALLALDDAVAEIVDGLRATGQLERTVLIFTADHGVLAGEHRIKRGKNRPYEEAISTPLLISGPGIAAGATVEAPVVNADLAPTILELAGATVPPELARPIDGVSLAAELAGAAAATATG